MELTAQQEDYLLEEARERDFLEKTEAMRLDIEAIEKAIDGISEGFYWVTTEQGQQFWSDVSDALYELLELAREKQKLNKEINKK